MKNSNIAITPSKLHTELFGDAVPITSIRRALTNLTVGGDKESSPFEPLLSRSPRCIPLDGELEVLQYLYLSKKLHRRPTPWHRLTKTSHSVDLMLELSVNIPQIL